MKKSDMRMVSVAMAAVLAAGLTGCGGSAKTETTTAAAAEKEAAGESSEAAGEESSAAAKDGGYKVAMISDTSVSDGGWGASCYQAMLDAAAEKGWETVYTDNVATSDYATVMTDMI